MTTVIASGILFQSKRGRILFLRRGNGGDYAGYWCFPGGKQEDGETLADCAIRETLEETGHEVEVLGAPFTRSVSQRAPLPLNPQDPEGTGAETPDEVDFTTYRVIGSDEFTPDLSDGEHTAYSWATADGPPEPLHPGAAIAIARLGANELVVARMVADGRLVSPTKFENVTLYAMRVSGTGVSYRKGIDEFVWRDPKVWITQEMADRCAGVPVVFEHPERNTLNSEEFADRVVGAVMFGYVKPIGDAATVPNPELWCVARIYDDEIIKLLDEEKMSTSPAVVFREPGSTSIIKLEDGTPVLIEGVPNLLDHLAICEKGVWDKGGSSDGVAQVDVEARVDSQPYELSSSKLDILSVKANALKIRMKSLRTRMRA